MRAINIDWNEGKEPIKDTYKGTGILIANGPSLADVPRDFLDKYPTIGTNNIYLYGMTEEEIAQYPGVEPKFYPDFYTIVGFNQLDTPEARDYPRPVIDNAKLAFVNRIAYPEYAQEHVYAIHGIKLSDGQRPEPKYKFSDDILDYVGVGYTNTYIMFQIMYYLGFETVLCVGLDNDYGADPDKLHFYHNDPRFSNEPNMGRSTFEKGSNLVFGLAKEFYEKNGRRIININTKNNTPFEGVTDVTRFMCLSSLTGC